MKFPWNRTDPRDEGGTSQPVARSNGKKWEVTTVKMMNDEVARKRRQRDEGGGRGAGSGKR